jgi:hypothetical protein
MVGLGPIGLICAVVWHSPFNLFLAGHSVSYLCFPLFGNLSLDSWGGKLGRVVVFAPGLLMLRAIRAMWQWAYY